MGKYLEDKVLDSVLENYFNEGVNISKPYKEYPEMVATYKEISKNKRVIEKEALALSANCCKVVPAELGEQIGDYAAVATALL